MSERKLTEEMEREKARLLNECPRPKNATGACGLPSCLLCWPALALQKGRAALKAALARESHLRGIIGGLNPGLDIDAALAAVPVETQEAAEPVVVDSVNDRYAVEHPHDNWRVATPEERAEEAAEQT